ncbi:MAG: hypothetical protein JWO20_623 [Candidatus Angelobacter sp.]|jgi:hypothetical protein|nr:hypothetical protein [Candidatus Angelobacter sp.]
MRELSKAFLAIGIALFAVAAFGPTFLAWLYHSRLTSRDWMAWMAIGIGLEWKWWMLASILCVTFSLALRIYLRGKPRRRIRQPPRA